MSEHFDSRMNQSDATMWRIERDPSLRTTIVGLAILSESPQWERLRTRIEEITWEIPRLRQKVMTPAFGIGTPRWVQDEDFDLDYHLRRVVAPEPGDLQAVLDLGADIVNDIWALRQGGANDAGSALQVVSRHPGCGVCLMHMHGEPLTMQLSPAVQRSSRRSITASPMGWARFAWLASPSTSSSTTRTRRIARSPAVSIAPAACAWRWTRWQNRRPTPRTWSAAPRTPCPTR